ncbi:MAG TPA: pitrilysin family protein, partial [Clostridia bacterium]|nr:pitrilysin family protein [Clostridia bacterium]
REQIERHLGDWAASPPPQMPQAEKCFTPALVRKNKDIEQIHLCLGFPGIELGSPDIYALSIFNNLFGGGMSSRLFQRIREDLGMAYSVYSYPTVLPGCGLFVLYAGTSTNHTQSVLEQLRSEITLLLSEGITPEAFHMAREQLKGSYILGLESPSSRMSNIGRNLLLQGRVRDEQEVLNSIAAATVEDVMRVARDMLQCPNGASIVGRGVESLPEGWLLGK